MGILSIISVMFYDLGIDEVWYILYARNFSEYLVPFIKVNDQIARLDLIAMLPYYILYYFYQLILNPSLIGIKILASIISVVSIGTIALILRKIYSTIFILLFITLIVMQPGFGFVATSFFGEICAVMFLICGAYLLFYNEKIVLGSIMLSLAIHTKFQLIYIILFSLFVLSVMYQDKKIFKALFLTFLFSFLIIIIRSIPLYFNHLEPFGKVIREFYGFASGYDRGLSWVIVERLQLYNKFFPILVFAFIISSSIMLLKNKFEKFIFVVFLVMNLYWILFFNFVTYRHLFMGVIPACFLLTKVLIFVCSELSKGQKKELLYLKYSHCFLFLYFLLMVLQPI
ncbi:MAG: hypothetical protein IPJ03_18155 [Ignavibacteriales bacterium]|nr:hypothetical protein [Ignavibacteriales bacterium]